MIDDRVNQFTFSAHGLLLRPLTQGAQHGAAVGVRQCVVDCDVLQVSRMPEDETGDGIRSIEFR